MFLLQEQPQHLLKRHQLSTALPPPLPPHHFHHTTPSQLHPYPLPTPYLLSPHSLSSPLYPHLPLPLPYLPPHTTIPYLPTTPTSNNHSFHHHFLHHSTFTFPFTYTHSIPPPHNSLPTPYLLPTYSVPTPFPHLSIHISHFHFHIFHLTPPFPPPLPPHTVNKHIIYW